MGFNSENSDITFVYCYPTPLNDGIENRDNGEYNKANNNNNINNKY